MGINELHDANLDNAQEDVAQLRFENRILRLMLKSPLPTSSVPIYSRPWTRVRTRDATSENADAMLSRFNGAPIAFKQFNSRTASDRRAFRWLTRQKLIVRVKRGLYQKSTL